MDLPGILLDKAISAVSTNAQKKSMKAPCVPLREAKFDTAAEKGKSFTFGFGKHNIMPPRAIPGEKTYYIAGYRNNNPAEGILDDLKARALWIDDNTGRGGVVFVSVDCVGLFTCDVNLVRERLSSFSAKTGCRSINIFSTHTHAGVDTMGLWGPLPKSGRDEEFMEVIYEGIIDAVNEAYKNRKQGNVYLGYTKADEGAQYVRSATKVCSDDITRLRFSPDDGSGDVYMVNFATHPESLEGKNSLVSADFPCYAAEYIKEHKNAEMMFFPGAIGGISMNALDEDNIISTIKTGHRFGELVCSIKKEKKLSAKIDILRQEMYLTCENPVFWIGAKLKIIPEKMVVTGKGNLNLGMKTEMSYIRFGELNMLLIPGELFAELAYGGYLPKEQSALNLPANVNPEPLCSIAGDDKLLVFGLANGEIGYIMAPNDYLLHSSLPYIEQAKDKFGRNHYPETNSLGPRTAYDIAKTFKEMLEKIK